MLFQGLPLIDGQLLSYLRLCRLFACSKYLVLWECLPLQCKKKAAFTGRFIQLI